MENREIKFRAWNEKGFFNKYKKTMHHDIIGLCLFEDLWYNDDIKIMQFTGLKDKNGKEIYEGDIVKTYGSLNTKDDEPFNCVVSFLNYSWQLVGNGKYCVTKNGEVIGNIYENPELIEDKTK